jgi:hypothetical protein
MATRSSKSWQHQVATLVPLQHAQCRGLRVAAVPQPPEPVELESFPILLGVDHEHPTRLDHQMVDVGPAPGDGQVMQDHPPLPLQGG